MPIAKIVRSGRDQFVVLPREFWFTTPEVEIVRCGDEIVLREKQRGLARAYELIANLPAEIDEIDDPPPQEREGL